MKKAKIDYTYFFNKSMETNVGMAACRHNISFRPEKNNFRPEKIKLLTEKIKLLTEYWLQQKENGKQRSKRASRIDYIKNPCYFTTGSPAMKENCLEGSALPKRLAAL